MNRIVTTGVFVVFFVLFGATSLLAADRYVATTGDDTANDCSVAATPCLTISTAITQASSGDSIKVAKGDYSITNTTYLAPGAKNLTFDGGYTTADNFADDTHLGVRGTYMTRLIVASGN